MKVVLPTQNTLTNEAFGVHLIRQWMKVGISTWNTLPNEDVGVHTIGQ